MTCLQRVGIQATESASLLSLLVGSAFIWNSGERPLPNPTKDKTPLHPQRQRSYNNDWIPTLPVLSAFAVIGASITKHLYTGKLLTVLHGSEQQVLEEQSRVDTLALQKHSVTLKYVS